MAFSNVPKKIHVHGKIRSWNFPITSYSYFSMPVWFVYLYFFWGLVQPIAFIICRLIFYMRCHLPVSIRLLVDLYLQKNISQNDMSLSLKSITADDWGRLFLPKNFHFITYGRSSQVFQLRNLSWEIAFHPSPSFENGKSF